MRVSSWISAIGMTSLLAVIFLAGCATGPTVRVDRDAAAKLSQAVPATLGQESFVLGGDIVLAVEGIGIGAPQAYELIRKRLIEIQAARGAVGVTVLRDGRAVAINASPGR